MKQFLEIGKINNTHGIKGEVKMQLWCDNFDYLKQFKTLFLDSNGANKLKIKSIKPQKNLAIIKFEGVNSIEEAENLKGKVLYCNREDATIEEGSNYIADLIGCYVVDVDTKDEYGQIVDVVNYGSCDIYDVESWGKHTLMPAIPDIIKEINLDYQVVFIKPMKGLFDEN